MRFTKKVLALMLTAVLLLWPFGSVQADAKEIKVATPKISIKAAKNEKGIVLTIGKTKNAESYMVYLTFEADNTLYNDGAEWYSNDYLSCEDKYVADVLLSGKKKRKVTIKAEELINANCKTLPAGKYTIKVNAQYLGDYTSIINSEFSKPESLTIEAKKLGAGYKSSYDFSKVKKGDTIKFGAYEQDGNFINGQEPIEWIVLKKTKSQIVVLSKYAIDYMPYNKDLGTVTWGTCTLRQWLNKRFYENAFNETEQGMIKKTSIKNKNHPEYKTPGGNSTADKVFLLSQLEMINTAYGFSKDYDTCDEKRKCAVTDYAMARGADPSIYEKTEEDKLSFWWWLRSPGYRDISAVNVGSSGSVDSIGTNAYYDMGIRPALVINL